MESKQSMRLSMAALVLGWVSLLGGLARLAQSEVPVGGILFVGVLLVFGVPAYRSARRRQLGLRERNWLRLFYEAALLFIPVVMCFAVHSNNSSLWANQPFPYGFVPAWLFISYIVASLPRAAEEAGNQEPEKKKAVPSDELEPRIYGESLGLYDSEKDEQIVYDPGPDILGETYATLQIDPQWSVHDDREFSWWGYRQIQNIWADEATKLDGIDNVLLNAEAAVLTGVEDTDDTRALLSASNGFPSLNALVYYPEDGDICYRCSVYVHEEIERWMRPTFIHSVSIQAADSYLRANGLKKMFGGEIATSEHPSNGFRDQPDGMLEVIGDVFVPKGQDPPAWPPEELEAVAEMESPSVMTNAGETGLTAEFPYNGDEPASVRAQKGLTPETALFQASLTEPHPQMGSGCFCRLTLPIGVVDPGLVNELNLRELEGESKCPVLGSWVHCDRDLTFVTFIPNGVYLPGLLSLLYLRSALRARWASEVLPDLM